METTTNTNTKTTKQKTPNLRCIVTGKERLTNRKYLEDKAANAGVSVTEYLDLYISRDALKLLRAGKNLSEVRNELNASITEPISEEKLTRAIKVNGKWSKE